MTSKSKITPVDPTLVAWVLFDATADVKYIKMNPADGSLAIFDTEEAAMSAKRLNSGTDYNRCEYYSVPKPAPEVTKLMEALEHISNMDSMSYHSLESAKIVARNAITAYRKGGDL